MTDVANYSDRTDHSASNTVRGMTGHSDLMECVFRNLVPKLEFLHVALAAERLADQI